MSQEALRDRIVADYGALSEQFRVAAQYVLDHPSDVALLTMREQARRAGVQPATMTRFAKHLGLDGYDRIREAHAETLRTGGSGFAGKARAVGPGQKGAKSLAAAMIASLAAQVASLAKPETLASLVAAAELLAGARRVYCVSLRSMHPIAWHFHYIMTLVGERSILLDGPGGTGPDALGRATADDVLLAATALPYTRATVELAEHAASRGIPVVAITDSIVSPLARLARYVVTAPTESPAPFHAMSPAFVVAEILAALVSEADGEETVAALQRTDGHLASLGIHLQPRSAGRRPRLGARAKTSMAEATPDGSRGEIEHARSGIYRTGPDGPADGDEPAASPGRPRRRRAET
nr:MurR/RpiR family transcriptional regulator [Methylobacterium sp. J-048]